MFFPFQPIRIAKHIGRNYWKITKNKWNLHQNFFISILFFSLFSILIHCKLVCISRENSSFFPPFLCVCIQIHCWTLRIPTVWWKHIQDSHTRFATVFTRFLRYVNTKWEQKHHNNHHLNKTAYKCAQESWFLLNSSTKCWGIQQTVNIILYICEPASVQNVY